MIQFIIRDFQAIEEAKINVEGLTILIGQSSSGKSACLRAISAAFNNRFKNGQVRHGTEQAVVKAKFSDSPQVFTAIRPWAGSIKMFLDKVPYNKLGRTLPLDISNLINTSNLDVSGEVYSLNFHEQFQKPLLLEFSQKKVMDLLSHSQALDDLQETKDALSEKRLENKGAFKSVDAILSNTKEQLSKVEEQISKVQPLEDELDIAITAYESFQKTLTELEVISECLRGVEYLKSALFELQTLVTLTNPSAKVFSIENVVNKLNTLAESISDKPQVLKKIESVIQLQCVCSSYNSFQNEGLTVDDISKNLQEKMTLQKSSEMLETKIRGLKYLFEEQKKYEDYERINVKLDQVDLLVKSRIQQDERLKQLNNIIINHICPVCGCKVE